MDARLRRRDAQLAETPDDTYGKNPVWVNHPLPFGLFPRPVHTPQNIFIKQAFLYRKTGQGKKGTCPVFPARPSVCRPWQNPKMQILKWMAPIKTLHRLAVCLPMAKSKKCKYPDRWPHYNTPLADSMPAPWQNSKMQIPEWMAPLKHPTG